MIKAAFFDIDGTLLSFETHGIPASTAAALAALREQGIKTVIASGRSPLELVPELREGFDAYVMLNGQLCYDAAGAYRDVAIDPRDVHVIVEQAQAGMYDVLVQQRDCSYVNRLGERVRAIGERVGLTYEVGDLSRALAEPVYQFCAFVLPGEEDVFLSQTSSVAATRWIDLFCDVVPKEGGKDYGVRATLERFGIAPEEAVAFGDGENDLPMFSAVGTSVAMGNALDAVKGRADLVTTSIDEDGIWNACRRLGLI